MSNLILPHSRRLFLSTIALGAAAWTAPGAFADELARTPAQTEGPFYPDRLPLDTDKHVYSNWDPLMQRRASHHPALDPLHATAAGRAQRYTPDMLPQTLEHLARTVSVAINHRWTEAELERVARDIKECAQRPQLVGR